VDAPPVKDRFTGRRHIAAAGRLADATQALQEALSLLADGHPAAVQTQAALLVVNAAQLELSREEYPSSWSNAPRSRR
jgi:hypothetical protein